MTKAIAGTEGRGGGGNGFRGWRRETLRRGVGLIREAGDSPLSGKSASNLTTGSARQLQLECWPDSPSSGYE